MKPLCLTASDIAQLSRIQASGCVRHFLVAGRPEEARRWSVDDAASTIKAVSGATPLGLDLLFNERQTSLGVWAPTWDRLDPWIQQWKLQNPYLLEYRPAHALPALKPGQAVQLCAIVPYRATKYPIETRFGQSEASGAQSPLVQFCNALPEPEAGSLLYVQFQWTRHPTPFAVALFPHWEILAHGRDPEALKEKALERYTYRAQIRVLVVHDDAEQATRHAYAEAVAEAFRLWDRPNANKLVPRHFALASRGKALRLLSAMWSRHFAWSWEGHLNRAPHYTKYELAALVHPPPVGAVVQRLPQQAIRAHVAPHSMVDLNNEVQRDYNAWRHRNPLQGPATATAGALTSAQARSALQRRNFYRGDST